MDLLAAPTSGCKDQLLLSQFNLSRLNVNTYLRWFASESNCWTINGMQGNGECIYLGTHARENRRKLGERGGVPISGYVWEEAVFTNLNFKKNFRPTHLKFHFIHKNAFWPLVGDRFLADFIHFVHKISY